MALYHTYRPQTWNDVVGQDHIVQTITNQIIKGTTAHAYLFSGPRGVGKTTSARLLAKALNCQNRDASSAEPCNTCQVCLDIQNGNAIDILEIDAASHTGVDNVREHVIDNAQVRPTQLPYKVFIIDEVHMLSTSAFNALLKTLEEPPSYVVFILATTELHKLPETIISRCQRFTFSHIAHDIMKAYLLSIAEQEGKQIDNDVLDHIAHQSDGCARDGVSLLEQLLSLGETHITLEKASLFFPKRAQEHTIAFVEALFEKDAAKAFTLLTTISQDGVHIDHIANEAVELIRQLMIVQLDAKAMLSPELQSKKILTSHTYPAQDLVRLMDILLTRRHMVKNSPIPTLPLELATVEWMTLHLSTSAPEQKSTAHTVPTNNVVSPPVREQIAPPVKEQPSTAVQHPPLHKEIITPPSPPSSPVQQTQNVDIKEVPQAETPKQEHSAARITKADIQKHWPAFLSEVEKDSPSLMFLLKMANITHVEGTGVTIAVSHTFHRDKLTDTNCFVKLTRILSTLLNTPITLSIVVESDSTTGQDDLTDIAATFGGEVIA